MSPRSGASQHVAADYKAHASSRLHQGGGNPAASWNPLAGSPTSKCRRPDFDRTQSCPGIIQSSGFRVLLTATKTTVGRTCRRKHENNAKRRKSHEKIVECARPCRGTAVYFRTGQQRPCEVAQMDGLDQ